MRIFNRSKFKNIRVFHNPKSLDFEYRVFLIDTDNYFWHKRSIYNYCTFEDRTNIGWLENVGVDISKMDFAEFLKNEYVPDDIPLNALPHEIEFINKVNESSKKIFKKRFESALEFVSTHEEIEIYSDFIYDLDFGLFIKTNFDSYETKQIFPELFNVIKLSILYIDDFETIIFEIRKTKEFFRKNLTELINLIHDNYLFYKDELLVDLSEEELELSCPKIDDISDLLDHIKFNTLEIYKNEDGIINMRLICDTKWDEEHGIIFLINSDGIIKQE